MPDRTPYEDALHAEMLAIRRIVAALDKVDKPARDRIIRYLVDRYQPTAKETP